MKQTNRYLLTGFILLCVIMSACTTNHSHQYERLLAEIDSSNKYMVMRQAHIAQLKLLANTETDMHPKLMIYDRLFHSYHDFQYDSAMVYAMKEIKLAKAIKQHDYEIRGLLHRSTLLALAGLYIEGNKCFQQVDSITVPKHLEQEYWSTKFLYTCFENDYYRNSEFENKLTQEIIDNVSKAIKCTPHTAIERGFYIASAMQYKKKYKQATALWKNYLKRLNYNNRYYAQSAFNLAVCYQAMGNEQSYEYWLIQAAIGDIHCATRQEAALQLLALHLFNKDKKEIGRIEKLMNYSLQNAKAYNSRMRLMGIAKDWPTIVQQYQRSLQTNNHFLTMAIITLSLMLIGLLMAMYNSYRKNLQLKLSRAETEKANAHLDSLNEEISKINGQLLEVNTKRENLAKVYIDLCNKYITRFKNFKTFVNRKIKTGQTRDLMARLSASEITQGEVQEFLMQFDEAFTQLYPTFLDELNTLLRNDCQIQPITHGRLTNELRVAALIRLGIQNSAEIANILFYSPQTVYNYRWLLKSKATDKDTFETNLTKLCRYQ